MRVVVPYTKLQPATAEALDASGWPWEPWYTGSSDSAYWELLAALWTAGETFALVEHDVVVAPDTLANLAECGSDWCAYQVRYGAHGAHAGLSCVKFGEQLIARNANALDAVALLADSVHPPKHWCRLDHCLQWVVLPIHNEQRHVHVAPILDHVRPNGALPQPSHGCTTL